MFFPQNLVNLTSVLFTSFSELYHIEVENIVNIYASASTVFAGASYTLNCTVVSEFRPAVNWIDSIGNPVNGSGIAIYEPVFYGKSTYVLLSFPALRTSQGGQYNCRSEIVVSSEVSTKIVTKDVIVTGQELERLLRCTYLNVGMLSTMVGYSASELPMQVLCVEVLLINYGIPKKLPWVVDQDKTESFHNWSTISAGVHFLVCVALSYT